MDTVSTSGTRTVWDPAANKDSKQIKAVELHTSQTFHSQNRTVEKLITMGPMMMITVGEVASGGWRVMWGQGNLIGFY